MSDLNTALSLVSILRVDSGEGGSRCEGGGGDCGGWEEAGGCGGVAAGEVSVGFLGGCWGGGNGLHVDCCLGFWVRKGENGVMVIIILIYY